MRIDQEVIDTFLREVKLEAPSPIDPVEVRYVPKPWEVVGVGNYAGVFAHPDYPDVVMKLYAPGRSGFEDEQEVYRRLGESKYFPVCYQTGENYLVIKRMRGISLFDCVRYGIPIPENVIEEAEEALQEARGKGLFPQDVHGKNVLMYQGHAYIIDVSDYLNQSTKLDTKWRDLRKAYYKVYLPFFKDRGWKVPLWMLDGVRKGYRFYKLVRRTLKGKKEAR